MRAQALGHECKLFIRRYDQWKRPIGRGLCERVPDFHPWLRWADLILLEGNSVYMTEADRWRAEGLAVIGGGVKSASWETDRALGMRIFRKAGVPVPAYREFTDYDDARAYVERRGEPFASKPCSATDDKALSYVAKSAEDLIFMLTRWKRKHGKPQSPFILQEKVSGIEFAVGGWFGPAGFAPGWEENFEHKKLMPGDIGPNTGELGTVMRLVSRSKLAERVLVPLEEELARIGYIGNIDVNTLIDEDGNPWPLEFTMRFGWPAFNIELALHSGDFIEFLSCIASGQTIPKSFRALNRAACGVVMAIPDFPYSHATRREVVGLPLYGLTDQVAENWHPCEMMKGEETELCSAGDYIGLATGTGATVREACRGAYSTLEKLSMPASPFWRNDIGRGLARQLPRLHEHGYALGLEY